MLWIFCCRVLFCNLQPSILNRYCCVDTHKQHKRVPRKCALCRHVQAQIRYLWIEIEMFSEVERTRKRERKKKNKRICFMMHAIVEYFFFFCFFIQFRNIFFICSMIPLGSVCNCGILPHVNFFFFFYFHSFSSVLLNIFSLSSIQRCLEDKLNGNIAYGCIWSGRWQRGMGWMSYGNWFG